MFDGLDSSQKNFALKEMEEPGDTKNSFVKQLEKIAEETSVAIVLVDENSSVQNAVNNNSICEILSASEDFAAQCGEFCGQAFQKANEAGKTVSYQCYAGLECRAVPLQAEKKLVAIVGRIFTKAGNYRKATERAIAGDWRKFPPTRFFENVLLSGSPTAIEEAAKKVENIRLEVFENQSESPQKPTVQNEQKDKISRLVEQFHQQSREKTEGPNEISEKAKESAEEMAVWRSFFGSLSDLNYPEATASILDFLARRYSLSSLAWLANHEEGFKVISTTGSLTGQKFRVNLNPDDPRLLKAFESGIPLKLRERTKDGEMTDRQKIILFPMAVGNEVRNALVIADEVSDSNLMKRLSGFCQTLAPEIEILRLQAEVKRRNWLATAVEKFNASLKNLDTEDFWSDLIRISAELMRAERSSLMIYDEKNDSFMVKAAIGVKADEIKKQRGSVGAKIARLVLQEGKPLVVADIKKIGLPAAPADWRYKTASFICYPFIIGERKIGVLNIADKTDGAAFGEFDLDLLNAIAPQFAVLIDRATLKNKTGELEQLSITDPLTGLLNRRYLEERLAEEIKRSNRYGYPMSFLMIDVDDFGKFNKDFGVLTGDRVLRQAVQAMRATLRSADVAARYGGEEFCVLLPQTTIAEATTIAERIRQSIEKIEFPSRKITVSIGVSTFSYNTSTAEDIIRAADEAMRRAKKQGKNNVQIYELPTSND